MGEHTPIAEKVNAEFDSFVALWRRRRWLAITLIFMLTAFIAWAVYSKWTDGTTIEGLEKENSKLHVTLREADRENRGLRETVAPLIARAAKEFPGEEINESLKKVVERLESDIPRNRLLASADVTVDIIVASESQVDNHFMDRGGYVAFGQGAEALLVASSGDSFGKSDGQGQVRYRAVFKMPADDKAVGKPLKELFASEYLQVEFAMMPENVRLLSGKAVVVFNGAYRIEYAMPSQVANGKKLVIRDIQNSLKSALN